MTQATARRVLLQSVFREEREKGLFHHRGRLRQGGRKKEVLRVVSGHILPCMYRMKPSHTSEKCREQVLAMHQSHVPVIMGSSCTFSHSINQLVNSLQQLIRLELDPCNQNSLIRCVSAWKFFQRRLTAAKYI